MKRRAVVSQIVEIEIDETKFTPEFMAEFNTYLFEASTLDDHIEHLAQLYARGFIDESPDQFIEGYGHAKDMGISMREIPQSLDIELQPLETTP